MRVLSVAYPFAPVGPRAVGGAEVILGELDRALVEAGQGSVVVGCAGSETAGSLYAVPLPEGRVEERDQARWRAQVQAAIDRALLWEAIDVVHLHGMDWHEWRLPAELPVLVTLHMPLSWYPAETFCVQGRNVTMQCVSRSQRAAGPERLRSMPVIENGVALPGWWPRAPRGDYAVALGRICPEKNVHAALEAGTRAGVPVHVAGQVFPYAAHQRYFTEEVEPRLVGGHRFLGAVGPDQRRRLLAGARCLLHPTLAPESSSLVAMEAMAVGTPVIAYRSGALADMIEDGVTGFLVDDVEGMAARLGEVDGLCAEDCRAVVERRWNRDRMVREYLQMYRALLRTGVAVAV